MAHCGIDTAFHLSGGEILVRVQDDLAFAPGLARRGASAPCSANPDIGMLGLRARTTSRGAAAGRPSARSPEAVDHVDLRAFAVTQTVLREHEQRAAQGERCAEGCRFQQAAAGAAAIASPTCPASCDRRRAARGAGRGRRARRPTSPFTRRSASAMARLRQSYRLGDDVLTPCVACDDEEFEVLAAQIDFCEAHDVPLGYTYTLRCTGCHELRFEEDHQFRCPDLTPADAGGGGRGRRPRDVCVCPAWCRASAFVRSSTTWPCAAA